VFFHHAYSFFVAPVWFGEFGVFITSGSWKSALIFDKTSGSIPEGASGIGCAQLLIVVG
jgi:hypothetical protein